MLVSLRVTNTIFGAFWSLPYFGGPFNCEGVIDDRAVEGVDRLYLFLPAHLCVWCGIIERMVSYSSLQQLVLTITVS